VLRVWVLVSFKILCEKLCLGIGFAFDIKKFKRLLCFVSLPRSILQMANAGGSPVIT